MKKIVLIILFCAGFFLYFPYFTKPSPSLQTVFRLTEQPFVIVKGTKGSALTVNISFGEQEIEEFLAQLEQPYPLLFLDMDWAKRFPDLAEKIKKRALPVALLGKNGEAYEEDSSLISAELKEFQELFTIQPLWFRTADEQFPQALLAALHKEEVNALGSSVQWKSGQLPKAADGEIIAVSFRRSDQIALADFQRLAASRPFESMESLLFNPVIKTKKYP